MHITYIKKNIKNKFPLKLILAKQTETQHIRKIKIKNFKKVVFRYCIASVTN